MSSEAATAETRSNHLASISSTPTSPPASSSAPTTKNNAMDLPAFQHGPHNRLSDAKRNCQFQLKLCFRCGQAGNFSRGCSNGNRNLQGRQQS
ncbi:uncharacterized protein VP01_10937g1, partial [Puccinia sorghi]